MGLANIAGPIQQLIIGALLLASVMVSHALGRASARRPRRRPQADVVGSGGAAQRSGHTEGSTS
jgi:hypothetical protein